MSIEWGSLALKLSSRAAKYGKTRKRGVDGGDPSGSESPVLFDQLNHDSEAADVSPWWWPQSTLLWEMLRNQDGGQSIATWITLGRYTNAGLPAWTTFLSQDSPPELAASIAANLRVLTAGIKVTPPTLTSSTMLADMLNKTVSVKRPLAPLVFFVKNSSVPKARDEQIIYCDWNALFAQAVNAPPGETSALCPHGNCNYDDNSPSLNGTDWFLHLASKKGDCDRAKAFIQWLARLQKPAQWDIMLTVPAWNPEHLPGVHVGAMIVYVRQGQWISKLFAESGEDAKEQIGLFSAAFRAGSTVTLESEIQEHVQLKAEAHRQVEMLRQVEAPLRRVSEALGAMQEETQMLRAILYDPHQSLFSVAPLVGDYFVDDQQSSFGEVAFKGLHKSDNIVVDIVAAHSAVCILASTICHTFGIKPADAVNEQSLYEKVVVALTGNEQKHFFETRALLDLVFNDSKKFVALLRKFLLFDLEAYEQQARSDERIRAQIHKEAFSGLVGNEGEYIKALFECFKNIVFTPFKFDGASPITPLCLILHNFNYFNPIFGDVTVKDVLKNGGMTVEALDYRRINDIMLFPRGSLPTPRYADILELVTGLLSFAKNEKAADISAVELTPESSLRIEFDKDVFYVPGHVDWSDTFDLVEKAAKFGVRKQQGNFRKPLVDFAAATYVRGEKIPALERLPQKAGFEVKRKEWVFQLEFLTPKACSIKVQKT